MSGTSPTSRHLPPSPRPSGVYSSAKLLHCLAQPKLPRYRGRSGTTELARLNLAISADAGADSSVDCHRGICGALRACASPTRRRHRVARKTATRPARGARPVGRSVGRASPTRCGLRHPRGAGKNQLRPSGWTDDKYPLAYERTTWLGEKGEPSWPRSNPGNSHRASKPLPPAASFSNTFSRSTSMESSWSTERPASIQQSPSLPKCADDLRREHPGR